MADYTVTLCMDWVDAESPIDAVRSLIEAVKAGMPVTYEVWDGGVPIKLVEPPEAVSKPDLRIIQGGLGSHSP